MSIASCSATIRAMTTPSSNERLLWVDLEMTGLNPQRDVILEVAAIVTDWDFNEIAVFESGVGQDVAVTTELLNSNPFYVKMKENKASLLELAEKSPPSSVVESKLVAFVKEHCETARPIVLAGNSIHMDRQFIRAQWPYLEQLLHYRMLDVTAWKLVFESKYGTKTEKKEAHRALGDIRESIDELKRYLSYIKKEG